jgi:hypothetical protein
MEFAVTDSWLNLADFQKWARRFEGISPRGKGLGFKFGREPGREAYWPDVAAFQEWARNIEELASTAPDEPIPFAVVRIPAKQRELLQVELEWARARLAELGF